MKDLFELLAPLSGTVDQLADTWHPDDPAYRADSFRQTMTSLSYAYFAYFHADSRTSRLGPVMESGVHAATQSR